MGWVQKSYKSWLGEWIHSHLSDDEAVAKMGHPLFFGRSSGASNYNDNYNYNYNAVRQMG